MASEYERIVENIKKNLNRDVENRFTVGSLVEKAYLHGATTEALAEDVGISPKTLGTYHRTWAFWGGERGPLMKNWSDYSRIAGWGKMEAAAAKAMVLQGENPAVIIAEHNAVLAAQRTMRTRVKEDKEEGQAAYRAITEACEWVETLTANSRLGNEWAEKVLLRARELVNRLVDGPTKRRRRAA